MPKKTKLHLQDLNVKSFIVGKSVKGGTLFPDQEFTPGSLASKLIFGCEDNLTFTTNGLTEPIQCAPLPSFNRPCN